MTYKDSISESRSELGTLFITRLWEASQQRVWQAWTEPDQLTRWWGPKGFTTPVYRIDLRVGGSYFNCMRAPDGQEFCNTGVFREIIRQERLVFTDSFADEMGNVVPATYYNMSIIFPLEMLVTTTFEKQGERTLFTLKHEALPMGEDLNQCSVSWNQSFDKLAEILAQKS